MSFSENLKDAMKLAGLTTKELAAKTGINESTISSYLKSKGSLPDIEKGYRLAITLNVSVKFLVTGFEENQDDKNKSNNIKTYSKYAPLIRRLDSLPEEPRSSIELMITDLSDKYQATPVK